jgi:protein TonB
VITNPQWSRRPQPTERDFPDRALQSGTSGSATVRCTVQANGRPTGCQVVSEEPSGYGFGRAAVRVVERGQLSPRTVDGAAQNATFVATIRFPIASE